MQRPKPEPKCWASLGVICGHVGLSVALILMSLTRLAGVVLTSTWESAGTSGTALSLARSATRRTCVRAKFERDFCCEYMLILV